MWLVALTSLGVVQLKVLNGGWLVKTLYESIAIPDLVQPTSPSKAADFCTNMDS